MIAHMSTYEELRVSQAANAIADKANQVASDNAAKLVEAMGVASTVAAAQVFADLAAAANNPIDRETYSEQACEILARVGRGFSA